MTENVWIIGGAILMGSLIVASAIERSRAKDYHYQLGEVREELERIKFALNRIATSIDVLRPRSRVTGDTDSWWNKTFGEEGSVAPPTDGLK